MSESGGMVVSEYTDDSGSVVRSDEDVEGGSVNADLFVSEARSDGEASAQPAARGTARKRKNKNKGKEKVRALPRPARKRKNKNKGKEKVRAMPRPPAQVADIQAFVTQKVISDLEDRFDGFKIRIPVQNERACSPPDGWMALYTAIFDIGVGLPLHPYFLGIIRHYGLAPGQIAPNGWSLMAGMYLLWRSLGFGEPSFEEWNAAYYISTKNADPYIFHFSFRPTWRIQGSRKKLLQGLTSSNSDWKTSFIFVPSVVAGQTYEVTTFVETHFVPPVVSSKEISVRILKAFKVADLSFDTIVGRRKNFVVGDSGRARITILNAPALRAKTNMVKPFMAKGVDDDAPFGRVRSHLSPDDSSGPKEKRQRLDVSSPAIHASPSVSKRLFQSLSNPVGLAGGGSVVNRPRPAWLAPMVTELESLAASPDRLGSLPGSISELLAFTQHQTLLAGLTANECKRKLDEELQQLTDRSARSNEEAARWREKVDRLIEEHGRLLDREKALQMEIDASKSSEAALRVQIDSRDSQIEELKRKVTELQAGVGLDRAAVFNSDGWSGLRKQMEEHYISGVIEDVMLYCGGDVSKYRGWLEEEAEKNSVEDGAAKSSGDAKAVDTPDFA